MAIVVALNNKRQSRAGLSGVINYVANDKKTLLQSGEKLVSGINCSPHSAYNEFMLTKHLHSKVNGRYFYHYCQSFSPEENVTPKTVHEIGVRLAKECFEGCEVIVGTHIEKNHLHNHILVNSVSFESGKKLHQDKKSLENIRTVSDKICSEYGLSVIKHKEQKSSETMTHGEYTAATLGNSWKFRLKSVSGISKKKDYDEDDTAAISLITGLSAASVCILIELIKNTCDKDLTEGYIEEMVEKLGEYEGNELGGMNMQ